MPVMAVGTKGRILTVQACVKNFFLQIVIPIVRVEKVTGMGRLNSWLVL
jgi:hypothetical protein